MQESYVLRRDLCSSDILRFRQKTREETQRCLRQRTSALVPERKSVPEKPREREAPERERE